MKVPRHFTSAAGDYAFVGCASFREALSARLDGESRPGEPAVLDEHLAGCAPCRHWQDRAEQLNRLIRVQAAPEVPPLNIDGIVAARPRRGRLAVVLRWLLGVLGLIQFGSDWPATRSCSPGTSS